jgi:hypothetical protein
MKWYNTCKEEENEPITMRTKNRNYRNTPKHDLGVAISILRTFK